MATQRRNTRPKRAQKAPGEESSEAANWEALSYDEVRNILAGIKDLPRNALDPITTARFLCASMPEPVRTAWRKAKKPLNLLFEAVVKTGYGPDCAQLLWELRSRFEQKTLFELCEASSPPMSLLVAENPEDEGVEELGFSEPVANDSHAVSIERAWTQRGKREHYTDFIALGVRVLEEAGCKYPCANRPDKCTGEESTASRTVVDIMCEVVSLVWNDSRKGSSPEDGLEHSLEAIEAAYQRGRPVLDKIMPAESEDLLIEKLNDHRMKRGDKGLGRIWVLRR